MIPRERFIAALERRPIRGRVPHFELVFFLTMEAFGKVHPSHRNYRQWMQMTEHERELHRQDMADIFIATARRYEHSAIFMHHPVGGVEEYQRLIDQIRERTGDTYFLMMHGDATYSIPSGGRMMEWVGRLYDHPQEVHAEAQRRVDEALECAVRLQGGGLDGFALCADYCFNTGPFLRPEVFAEVVTPYLKQLIAGYRELGFYAIKHTDGNIMPIIDQLVDCRPHALHSLDPQGGVDIAEVKALYGDQVCLCGNVNCGLIDTGTEEEYLASARYAMEQGMPGGGYIFCTSNCVYTGMKLERYDKILDLWREIGNYGEIGKGWGCAGEGARR
jgi:uroporphyrinogen decarboxylase